MTPRAARIVRGGLLVVLVGVSGVVVLSLRGPGKGPAPAPSPSPSAPPAREGTRLGVFVHRTGKRDKDGNVREGTVVHAESIEGKAGEDQRLKGVAVNLTYMAKGQPRKATSTA